MQYMNDENFFESYQLMQVEDWLVKISKMNDTIQVFLYNPSLGQTAIQWFNSEQESVEWVEFMAARYSY